MIGIQRPQSALTARQAYRPRPRPPCRSLLEGLECHERETCPGFHNLELINKRRCIFGYGCWYMARGECKWIHTREEQYLAARTMMEKGLFDPMILKTANAKETAFGDWVGIKNVEVIASFSCLRGGEIAVPGLPPAFVRPTSRVDFDTRDMHLRKINPHSKPAEPPKFQPLAQALRFRRPDLSLVAGFQIVTTAGCLRRLTDFLYHGNNREFDSAQRIDIEVRENTLFMGRWEGDVRNHIHTGYGKQFEYRVTSFNTFPELKDTVSSHIAMAYEMGDLKMVVQAEIDAICCKCHTSSKVPWENPEAFAPPQRRISGGRYDVLSLDTGNEGEEPTYGTETITKEGTKILHVGREVDLSCCVEIKTRIEKAWSRPSSDFMTQLYFQRASKVFLALHKNGTFQPKDMWEWDATNAVRKWEADNQALLARLVKLLEDIKARAMAAANRAGGQCKMALVLGKGGPAVRGGMRKNWNATLFLREDRDSMLPEDL
ncbi:hypothetical protein jhhlp_002044 [Lomentospora prolificans]|uniref:Uncharacterized protein n=1 Tax=Lomentospora prolificans TaxID=41688 RepID=A0A2N3NCZ8_9PEZI|nr:hypothetical protein jhhlp_002044 [Lomentospora prolificans]